MTGSTERGILRLKSAPVYLWSQFISLQRYVPTVKRCTERGYMICLTISTYEKEKWLKMHLLSTGTLFPLNSCLWKEAQYLYNYTWNVFTGDNFIFLVYTLVVFFRDKINRIDHIINKIRIQKTKLTCNKYLLYREWGVTLLTEIIFRLSNSYTCHQQMGKFSIDCRCTSYVKTYTINISKCKYNIITMAMSLIECKF